MRQETQNAAGKTKPVTKAPSPMVALLRKHIRNVVYGGTDGIITIFAIVAGVSGASLPSSILLILGLSTLIADALSMSVSDYVSTMADNEVEEGERQAKMLEAQRQPDLIAHELMDIYLSKGYLKEDAEALVKLLMKKPSVVVDTVFAHQKLEEAANESKPAVGAAFTFISFVIFGLIPLLCDIVLQLANLYLDSFLTACFLTAFTLFGLGSAKAAIVGQEPIQGGIQLVTIGGFAALSAYFVAYAVAGFSSE
eukprot:TRINITY_DN12325_c0_g1_i1.p1 TRINITY_DN12325_c0_g1~~TRINITY_DN12325_c0_g1_i1.p1  ORF type:complete len:253 (-),score=58.66 TRINITY_DN12325_c0_g1_i1:98-856(-)